MRVRLLVHGLVQGVGFRYFARQMADGLGVTGWVINNSDFTVSIEAESDKRTLEKYVKCIEKGPTYGRVERLEQNWYDDNKGYHTFEIKF